MLWANQLIGALVRHKPYKRRPRTRAIGGLVESLPPLTPPLQWPPCTGPVGRAGTRMEVADG